MTPTLRAPLTVALALALLVAACGTAASSPTGAPSTAPGTSGPPPMASGPSSLPIATDMPPATGGGTGGAPGSGSVPAGPGGGTVTSPPDASGGGAIPEPQPTMVTPVGGLADVRAVGASAIEAQVSGRDVIVRLSWWSGPAPCSVLAGVDTARAGTTFTLTIREGAAQQGVACPEIAMLKATLVDLGPLDPGSYTIAAYGQAPPVQVTVTS